MSWSPDSQLLAVTIRAPVSASKLVPDGALTTGPSQLSGERVLVTHLLWTRRGQYCILMCAGMGRFCCTQQPCPGLAAVQLALVPEERDLRPGPW